MSDLESRIHESYERLHPGTPVYLLRDVATDYGELPDPDTAEKVFKASVVQTNTQFVGGVSVISWPDFQPPADKAEPGLVFKVSPREVFKLGELKTVIRSRTNLGLPKQSKIDRYINSKSGVFGAVLAAEMARVILERFAEDPRDGFGNLQKR